MSNQLTYDQPFNETIRVCLRLEQLFQSIDHQMNELSIPGTRQLIHLIINLLHLLDRPDLKSKLAKELTHHLSNLSRYNDNPHIDAEKLVEITHSLNERSRSLIDSSGKIGHRLRDIELLNMLRLHLASPGGGCSFDLPLYYYWLNQPTELRREIIMRWLNEFAEIRAVITLILDLIRLQAKTEEKIAEKGFYQELLDPQANMRMLRVTLNANVPAYPEMSIGRHFLSIRFFSPDIDKRPEQYPHDVTFMLSYCNS